MKKNTILKDEEGYMIIVVLLFLLLLTITGIASTNSSDIELKTALNNSLYKRNFYRAEAVNVEVIRKLMSGGQYDSATINWQNAYDEDTLKAMRDPNNWDDTNSEASTVVGFARYAAVGPRDVGDSADMTKESKLTEVITFGLYDHPDYGRALVEVGYKKYDFKD